jgi:serine beta-lactamase-like protein LACTB
LRSFRWTETLLALVVVGIGLLLAAFAGFHTYITATAPTWHPDPAEVPSAPRAAVPGPWAEAADTARQAVRAAVSEQNVPGLSVAVGVDGELAWAEGFGWADLDRRTPVTPATRFRIGSASTVLTSAGAGLLLEQGRLRLDEDIRRYVPDFPERPWPVTLRHLMAHVAGLGSDGGDEGPLFSQHCPRAVDALPHSAGRELLFEPGTAYRCGNYAWIVVSAAIEAVTNEPVAAFLEAHVFAPAGMTDTTAESTAAPAPDQATTYFPRYGADPRYGLHPMRDIDLSCYAGASVFVSTPTDLVRFGMAVNGGTLLGPETVRQLQTSYRLPDGSETGYGLGWDLETLTLGGRPAHVAGHDGALLGGPVASLWTWPDRGLVVAVTSNIPYTDTASVATMVAEVFAGALTAGGAEAQ